MPSEQGSDGVRNFPDRGIRLNEVNVEDRGYAEKVCAGLSSGLARQGWLSHVERPNYDFARHLCAKPDA